MSEYFLLYVSEPTSIQIRRIPFSFASLLFKVSFF